MQGRASKTLKIRDLVMRELAYNYEHNQLTSEK